MMWALLLPTSLLIASVVDDLKTKKVHNWLILTMAGIAVLYQLIINGLAGLGQGALGMLVAILVCLPLVLVKGLGAGDLKVLAVLGLATNWNVAVWTAFFSLVWGALFGVLQAVFSGQALVLAKNTFDLLKKSTRTEVKNLHRIPYTVALLFGWLTYVSLNGGFNI